MTTSGASSRSRGDWMGNANCAVPAKTRFFCPLTLLRLRHRRGYSSRVVDLIEHMHTVDNKK